MFIRAWAFNRDFTVHQTGMQNVMVTKMKCTTGKKTGHKNVLMLILWYNYPGRHE